jgi:signal transduction histidine kinase
LNELAEAVFISQQPLAQERELTLEYQPAEPGPEALVDPDRMTQVLTNLVTNAIQYTTRGGNIVISTGEEKGQDHTWATVTVTDTGMGIAREELPHIFERFFRGERPRSMQVPGTGLGLSIVKDIVELHGGQVTVESKIDVGTTFTIWLPPMNSNAR